MEEGKKKETTPPFKKEDLRILIPPTGSTTPINTTSLSPIDAKRKIESSLHQLMQNGNLNPNTILRILYFQQNEKGKINFNNDLKVPQTPKPTFSNQVVKPPPRPKTPQVHPKKPKRSTSINSFVYESRPRPVTPVVNKPVMTPEWNQEKLVQFSSESSGVISDQFFQNSDSKSFPSFEDEEHFEDLSNYDYAEAHKNIEVYESRIQCGIETGYGHPAEAHLALAANPHFTLNDEELERSLNYNLEPVINIVPAFWPRRPWDKEGDILTPQATAELKEKMEEAENSFV